MRSEIQSWWNVISHNNWSYCTAGSSGQHWLGWANSRAKIHRSVNFLQSRSHPVYNTIIFSQSDWNSNDIFVTNPIGIYVIPGDLSQQLSDRSHLNHRNIEKIGKVESHSCQFPGQFLDIFD